MFDGLHHQLHFVLVVGVVLVDRPDELFHQHVVDFFRVHALEGQVEVADGFVQGMPGDLLPLGHEVPDERLDVLVDPEGFLASSHNRQMPAADHDQILHQIRMKALAQLQQQLLFDRIGHPGRHFRRQLGIPPSQIIDLFQGFDHPPPRSSSRQRNSAAATLRVS